MSTAFEKQHIIEQKDKKIATKNYISRPNMKSEESLRIPAVKESEMKANWLDEHSTENFLW